MSSLTRSGVQRLLLSASALGEIGMGAAVLVFPEILGVLLNAKLDSYGLLVGQLLGAAALALGVTWWMARRAAGEELSRYAIGYIVFNFAMGFLFILQALEASRPAVLPWIVGGVHLLAALGFVVTPLLRLDEPDPAAES